MIPHPKITDHARFVFFQKLEASDLLLSDWEGQFLASWRLSARPTLWFTEGRRIPADKMRMKYGSEPEIGMPFPMAETSKPNTPAANKDCCMFLKRDDARRLTPCNDPGELINRNGFIYCTACGEEVQKVLRRRGGHMELRTYTPKK